MLKYSNYRIIQETQQDKNNDDEKPFENIIETANIIYDKFAESGSRRSDSDFRFLLGLGYKWGCMIPDEFKPAT